MICPKPLCISLVALGLGAGALIHHARHNDAHHGSWTGAASTGGESPTAFPGNATPEAALQSLCWAAGRGDFELLRSSVTPEVQKMLHEKAGPNAASHAIAMATQIASAKFLRQEPVSESEVLLYVQPQGKKEEWQIRMQKADGGWRLAGLTL